MHNGVFMVKNLILYTSKQKASGNIAEKMIEKGYRGEIIDTKVDSVLDVPTDFDADRIIVLSPHKSKTGKPMLTAHVPGNWSKADFGGEARTLNTAYGSMLRKLILNMRETAEKKDFKWEIVLEADHHGPTCKLPIIFVEIGSTENEWGNDLAGEIIAEAVMKAIEDDEKVECFFGVGGGHYAREFTDYIAKEKVCVGHILPKYAIESLDEDTFKQAVEKNVEKVGRVVVLKESTNKGQKEKIKDFCSKFNVKYEEL